MQNQRLLKTLNFGLFEIDFWSTSVLKDKFNKLKYWAWYHKECLTNLIKGKKYRKVNGQIFIYRDYIVRYLGGSPESKGIKVDLSYWNRRSDIGFIGPFHGFFDYSIGRWVTNKRELNDRLAQGKVFASNDEIAQEAKYRRELIQKEDKKQLRIETQALVHKNFKQWREGFNKNRAEHSYKELVKANKQAQETGE